MADNLLKKRKQKIWSEAEMRRAWVHKRRGKSNREIGLILGRSVGSVHYMIDRTYDWR